MHDLLRSRLLQLYTQIRGFTESLTAPLHTEDFVVQTNTEVSPTKWHLAHTSWFFETFVLRPAMSGYRALDDRYAYLFNSYYHAAGDRFPQPRRGTLSRPTVEEVFAYRHHVDGWMKRFLEDGPMDALAEKRFVIELGLNHEEQHQELILTDLKHVLGTNPLEPAYARTPRPVLSGGTVAPLGWVPFESGVRATGHAGGEFAFDNEGPRHDNYLGKFELGDRLVTAGEYLQFMADGGYSRSELWLSDGWDVREAEGWVAPLYWREDGGGWRMMTLHGARAVDPAEPVCHVSYYEADAYARWAGARLPSEAEWEVAAASLSVEGNFVESGALHPCALELPGERGRPAQMLGDVWEWTASAYLPYPGYAPFSGALGEYNGKFMSNRMVLRGGSCATPKRHIRATYRNFFVPPTRWQFSGIRLARTV